MSILEKFNDPSIAENLWGNLIVAFFVIVLICLIVMALVHYYDTFVR